MFNDMISATGTASFHEEWYEPSGLELIKRLIERLPSSTGQIIEIGCWEGRSAVAIANACFPETLLAVDTWQGSFTEGNEHPTVQIAKSRDVYAVFQENIRLLTKGNVAAKRMDALDFLRTNQLPIKFCHVDAAHDYPSVRDTLTLLLPRLVSGGILVGHDYESAHLGRQDLQGGVQRAVQESLSHFCVKDNNWWYVKDKICN
jgi:hypothetical protein